MNPREFVFSDKPVYRYQRHIAFWTVRFFALWLFNLRFFVFDPPLFQNGLMSGHLYSVVDVAVTCFFDIVCCYSVAYWLVPKYLQRRKYRTFGVLLALLTVSIFTLKALAHMQMHSFFLFWYEIVNAICNGPLIICGIFMAIRMLKTWYLEEEQKVVLIRENADAELQLLKTQVHPHFLFNTLNNIYAFTLNKSVIAGDMVSKLSGILRYMITECEAASVPLEKEIRIIDDYLALERVRYTNRLTIVTEIKDDFKNKLIAPLLLIPFLENSFKHGASKTLRESWITLKVDIRDNEFYFDLTNSKPRETTFNVRKGIGLNNVQKRLNLLYPGMHTLKIEDQSESFSVQMRIILQSESLVSPGTPAIKPSLAYVDN